MELHPLCSLFPRMAGVEYTALVADIRAHGLRQPIVIHEGMILDGGNRYRACEEAGVTPETVAFNGPNLVSFVLSANLHRRHMSAGQQAAIVASATDWGNSHQHGGERTIHKNQHVAVDSSSEVKKGALVHLDQVQPVDFDSVEHRAALSGAGRRTQIKADKLVREHPEAAREVTQGRKSLYRAVQETQPAKPAKPAKPSEAETIKALEEELEETRDALVNAQEVASSLALVGDVGIAVRFEQMSLEIKTLKASRDHLLNENAILKADCKKYLRALDMRKAA